MEVVKTIKEVRSLITEARRAEVKIGFVPTMGYLHRGHLSLVETSREYSGYQTMSIFVNRIQFNDQSDFASYPRNLERDLELAEGAGVDMVFIPDETELYREHKTRIEVEKLTDNLCGAVRPGHFSGVFTVVSKLFNIIQPDAAIFGQKDIQQAVSIRKMVLDLNFPVNIIIAPIIREDDGLAMSSRNKHLNPDQRQRALSIYRSLRKAESMIGRGERSASALIKAITSVIEEGSPDSIDYVSMVDYEKLEPTSKLGKKCIIALAAFFGNTRLIDNMIVDQSGEGFTCIY